MNNNPIPNEVHFTEWIPEADPSINIPPLDILVDALVKERNELTVLKIDHKIQHDLKTNITAA